MTNKQELLKLSETITFLLERDFIEEAASVASKFNAELASVSDRVFYVNEVGARFDVTHIFGGVTAAALQDRKVGFIKDLREYTDTPVNGVVYNRTGLKAAKEFVEDLIDKRW